MTCPPDMLHNGLGRIVLEEGGTFEADGVWTYRLRADGARGCLRHFQRPTSHVAPIAKRA